MNYAQRRDNVRRLLVEKEANGMLVTNFHNVTYLTGFTGDDSYLLFAPGRELIISDPRYQQQLADECPGFELVIRRPGTSILDTVAEVVPKVGATKLAIEADSVTVDTREKLGEKLKTTQFGHASGLVEGLREIKEDAEVAQIRQAIWLAEKAFAVIRAALRPGQTEQEIAWEIERQIRLFGGKGCSFEPIVGVNARAALPHGRASTQVLRNDDFVLIDWGARGRLYISDLTRVLAMSSLSAKFIEVYSTVLAANKAGIAAIRPGAVMQDVDAAARQVIVDAGFGEAFGHSLGHGIGLEVHEAPRLAPKQDRKLQPGMVVTVEPGIYFPDWGGVRIEDDILVTPDGHEVLTGVPKELEDCVVI